MATERRWNTRPNDVSAPKEKVRLRGHFCTRAERAFFSRARADDIVIMYLITGG